MNRHTNLRKSILQGKAITASLSTRNSKEKHSGFTIFPEKSSFIKKKRNKMFYLRSMMNSNAKPLEAYQSTQQELFDTNLRQLLTGSHVDMIQLHRTDYIPIDAQTKAETVDIDTTMVHREKERQKNRTIVPKLTLGELDSYYNDLYHEDRSRNNMSSKKHVSPSYSSPHTEPNSHVKTKSRLKKISTGVIMKDLYSSRQEASSSIPNTEATRSNNKGSNKKAIIKKPIPEGVNSTDGQGSLSIIKAKSQSHSLAKSAYNNYKLPEGLLTIRHRLQNQINDLAIKSSEKTDNSDNRIADLEQTKGSNYSKMIIEKIKLVNGFLATQSESKFKGTKLRHRKVFVIIDGQVILNRARINGAFIEIPTLRYLNFLETKKERLEKYYEFLAECQRVFNKSLPFRSLFLLNGLNVFDLTEIPQSDKAVYVSMGNIFRGVHLFNAKAFNINEADYDLMRLNEWKVGHQKNTLRNATKKLFLKKKTKKQPKARRAFNTVLIKKQHLTEQSFTFGKDVEDLEREEYLYYSDNDKRCRRSEKEFGLKYKTLIDHLLFFNEVDKSEKIAEIKKKEQRKLLMKLTERVKEDTKEGLDQLIIKYNVDRGRKYNINMNHQKKLIEKQNQEEEFAQSTRGMGIQLLRQLRIFREYKDIDIILDEKEFYKRERASDPIESIINRNIKRTYDITQLADRDIQRYFPDLVSLNIPRVLKSFPSLKRREFYDIFIQYKMLLMICVCISQNLKLISKGIDFDTFFHCNPPIKSQGRYIAQKIFNTLNVLDMKYINWEEYMRGMLKMKSKGLSDKIDMFFRVIDADSNGLLSFEEVYNLSVTSLSRSLGTAEDDEVIQMLAKYFANLIFQIVGLPIDEGITFGLIKSKIIEGKSAAGYLEMFICSDNFM